GAPKGPRRTLVGPTFSAINRCLAQPAAQAGTPFEAALRFAPQGEVGGLRGVRNPPSRDRAPSVRLEPLARVTRRQFVPDCAASRAGRSSRNEISRSP